MAEPQSAVCPRLRIYPRVNELVADTSERASKLTRESKPLSRVIPLRCKVFPVVDQPDYSSLYFLNPDFELLPRTLVAGQSQSYWLLSTLLAQLKQDGFKPSDPALSIRTFQHFLRLL